MFECNNEYRFPAFSEQELGEPKPFGAAFRVAKFERHGPRVVL